MFECVCVVCMHMSVWGYVYECACLYVSLRVW